MGHGFDDEGRQFDAKGRLRDWWTPATATKYKVKADRLAAQFDQYEPIPGVHIKGKLTLGENLADLAGSRRPMPPTAAMSRATASRRSSTASPATSASSLLTHRPGRARRAKARSAQQLLSNPHSPEKYRVDGIVRNFDPWYKAFNVQPGDKLYLPPEQRVHVW